MSLRLVLLLVAAFSLFALSWGQINQGVRLANSSLGSHAGRVEVQYNGRWGTICDSGWSSYDGSVVCRMLNYTRHICSIRSATPYFGEGTGPVWLTNLRCGYGDPNLDDCGNSDPQTTSPCAHNRDAAVICQDNTVMPVPYNITQTNQTTRTVTLAWKLPYIPPQIQAIDFWLNLTQSDPGYRARRFLYHIVVTENSRDFTFTITGLTINQTYMVDISADGEYQWCSYNEIEGNNSETITIETADSVLPSTLPMRLLAASDTETPYIGRLQVQHDGDWGNVCNDFFGAEEADVACMGLNYTNGAICYATSTFYPSTDPMWLDDVDCSYADRFEDCTHRGWGIHNCGLVSDSIGLICDPGPSGVPAVTGLRASAISHTSITIQWDRVLDTGRYWIRYGIVGDRIYSAFARPPTTEYTLRRLVLGFNYTINITAGLEFRNFRGGNCFSRYLYGEFSDPIVVETQETAPSVPITNFHITVLNSTAVEATWRPPTSTADIGGEIRGYKLVVDKINGTVTIININDEFLRYYIVKDLEPSATYLFSITLYTVGDGPQSVRLQVTMPDGSFNPLISKFGVYGNGVESITAYTSTVGFNVLCGSLVKDATFAWKFANGSRIGINNPGFREAQFENGTAVLQIGTALPYTRRLTLCDGGVYTCVATYRNGTAITRNFSLQIGVTPPAVDQPQLIQKGSTWVQIGWEPVDCDGGFQISSYTVEYKRATFFSSYTTAGSAAGFNFTIRDLASNTQYDFRVGSLSDVTSRISYSRVISVITQVAGPSPPRGIELRVGYNAEVCASWRPPATPVGEVTLYKLYAEIVDTSSDAIDAIDIPSGTVVKTFAGSMTSGCMLLNHTGVIYHFQMSAVALVNGEKLEGTLSPITSQTTRYVPKPGVPQPVNLQGNATNTSVTLRWELPKYVQQTDSYFNITYSGVVEWISGEGVYTSFKEQGQETADKTSLTISPLTPSTVYTFRVAMVTPQGQKGEGVEVTVNTTREVGDKLAYFQIRIQNINDCDEWQGDDTKLKLGEIQQSLAAVLNTQCQCDLTTSHISQGEFSCRTGPVDTITYRARLSGTASRSASDLASLVREWVAGGEASIKVGTSRLHLDPTCDASLVNIHAPDCAVVPVTQETTSDKETTPTKPVTEKVVRNNGNDDNESDGTSSGQVAGILLGGIIAGLMLALLIALIIIIYIWMKKQNTKSFKAQSQFKELEDDPIASNDKTADDNF